MFDEDISFEISMYDQLDIKIHNLWRIVMASPNFHRLSINLILIHTSFNHNTIFIKLSKNMCLVIKHNYLAYNSAIRNWILLIKCRDENYPFLIIIGYVGLVLGIDEPYLTKFQDIKLRL